MPKLPTKDCTGCTACMAVCPVDAITMEADAEGFLRPVVKEHSCMDCGKCEKHCPVTAQRDVHAPLGVYAAKAVEEQVQRTSQSGGVFYVLARNILARGGVVYGAALDENFVTEHIRADDPAQLSRLQGVKYVQSRMGGCFRQAGEDLQAGKYVLFSGTPCQIAGLYSFLEGRRIGTDKLLTADIVCYGVPSPGLFRDWLECLEKAQRCKLEAMQYRRTDALWGKGKEYYRMHNGKVLEGGFYTQLYFRNLIIRPGCESCRYCNTSRPADITLGDFWGIEKHFSDFYDDRGVSVVLVSTQKGAQALTMAGNDLVLRESTLAAAVEAQPRLQGIPVKPSKYRTAFWDKYRRKGMAYIAMEEGFLAPSLGWRVRRKLEAVKIRLRRSRS